MSSRIEWSKALGPGVLYAAASVGASHLVQSTRAGASYGLALVALILLTFIAKYPAFRFGAQYTAATGHSLLHGYRGQGLWAVALYVLIALGTMFAVVPAVTLLTAGLAKVAFQLQADTFGISVAILLSSTAILIVGGYHVLDRLVKILMVVLSVATVAATVLVIPNVDWTSAFDLNVGNITATDVFFVVALLGLMPSSVDLSVWHSLWSVAKIKDSGRWPTLAESAGDFHVGYVGAFVLAICFVVLGAGVMHNSGLQFADGAAEFSSQLIDLYKMTLGEWSGPLIGFIAVAVMFSTVLTGLDGYPRAAVSLLAIYAGNRSPAHQPTERTNRLVYAAALGVLVGGCLLIMYLFVTSLRFMIDVASTTVFLFAPIIAWLNHRAIVSAAVPENAQPGRGLRLLSVLGIVWLTAFSAYYLLLQARSWIGD